MQVKDLAQVIITSTFNNMPSILIITTAVVGVTLFAHMAQRFLMNAYRD